MPQPSLPTPKLAPTCFTLFLLAFFCAFGQVSSGLVPFQFGPGFEVTNVAEHLATSGQFADPFSIPTGSTAHVAPVYTAVMALVFKIFGYTYSAALIMTVLNAVLLALCAAILPVLSQRVFAHPAPGVAGGIMLVLAGKLNPTNEATLSAAMLLVTTLIFMRNGKLAAGFSLALSILTNPISLLAGIVIGTHRGKKWSIATGGLAMLFCLPWIARNYFVLGAPYFIRDNLGLELYLSNQDQATSEMATNTALQFHPTTDVEEARQVAAIGEAAYNHAKLKMAIVWIRNHPRNFVSLSAARVFHYWFPSRGWVAYGFWIVNMLAIPGFWLARGNSAARILASAAVVYSLPYTLIQSEPKYGYPMLWVAALLAGYTVYRILSKLGVNTFNAALLRGSSPDDGRARASIADRHLRIPATAPPNHT